VPYTRTIKCIYFCLYYAGHLTLVVVLQRETVEFYRYLCFTLALLYSLVLVLL
jgi:hypothetical protein